MYQGPALVSVDPCGYPDPFKVADFQGVYHYGRDAIDNPPQAPAVSHDISCFREVALSNYTIYGTAPGNSMSKLSEHAAKDS